MYPGIHRGNPTTTALFRFWLPDAPPYARKQPARRCALCDSSAAQWHPLTSARTRSGRYRPSF